SELYWRHRGFVPSLNDSAELWMRSRGQVRPDDRRQVVFVGDSRIQQGINTRIFAQQGGFGPPVQLAVAGSNPLPVLDHLSRDGHFRGLLICDVMPQYFFAGINTRAGKQGEYVRDYHPQ